jgi:hypothetical protein
MPRITMTMRLGFISRMTRLVMHSGTKMLEQFENLGEDVFEGHKCLSAGWVPPLCERLR